MTNNDVQHDGMDAKSRISIDNKFRTYERWNISLWWKKLSIRSQKEKRQKNAHIEKLKILSLESPVIIDELQTSYIFKENETIKTTNCEFIETYSMNGDITGNHQKLNYRQKSNQTSKTKRLCRDQSEIYQIGRKSDIINLAMIRIYRYWCILSLLETTTCQRMKRRMICHPLIMVTTINRNGQTCNLTIGPIIH